VCSAALSDCIGKNHFWVNEDPLPAALTDHKNLGSLHFKKLSSPGWFRWAPQIYASLDASFEADTNQQAQTLAGLMGQLRSNPITRAHTETATAVLLSETGFDEALNDMGYCGQPAIFRQADGTLIINSARAFSADNQHLSDSGLKAINLIIHSANIAHYVQGQPALSRLLPVRFHHDERYLSKEESVRAVTDQMYREALVAEAGLEHLDAHEQHQMRDFTRLSGGGHLNPHKDSFEPDFIIRKLIGYTLMRYAELLEEKINPLLQDPIHVSDYIRQVNVKHGAEMPTGSPMAFVLHNLRDGLNLPRDLFILAQDAQGVMHIFDNDLLHELVHIASNEQTFMALERHGAKQHPTAKNTEDALCSKLLAHRNFFMELATEWLRNRLVQDHDPDTSRPKDQRIEAKLLEGDNVLYKSSYFTLREGIADQGEAFLAPLFGKTTTSEVEADQLAERLWPQMSEYCKRAMKTIKARGEWD
jgi:hypothetical protein